MEFNHLKEKFQTDLEKLINKHSVDNDLNLSDRIIAEYLIQEIHNLRLLINKYNRENNELQDMTLKKIVKKLNKRGFNNGI
jgi:hypothetical protein